jgi:hypothetical protein
MTSLSAPYVRVIRSILPAVVLGGLVIAFMGCDSGGTNAPPEPQFEATLGPPVNTSLRGKAALGDASSFQNGALFAFTVPELNRTITAVQLFGTDGGGTPHDLSFTYIADESLGEGTYTLEAPRRVFPSDSTRGPAPGAKFFRPDSIFTASYGRRTTDSLFTYSVEGSVTIENVDDQVVEGRFDLEAPLEIGLHRDSLKAHIESLREPSNGPIGPPPFRIQPLDEPMSIEGTFTATPREFAHEVTHVGWLAPGGA